MMVVLNAFEVTPLTDLIKIKQKAKRAFKVTNPKENILERCHGHAIAGDPKRFLVCI